MSNSDFLVSNVNMSLEQKGKGLEASPAISLQPDDEGMEAWTAILAAISAASSTPTSSSHTGMLDSTINVNFPVVPVFQVKQPLKAAACAAGSIIAVGSSAYQPRAEIQEYQQQTMNNINRQTQHCQPWISNPSAETVRGISSSSLMDRQTQHWQPWIGPSAAADRGISSSSLMYESLHECSTYFKSRFSAAMPTSNLDSIQDAAIPTSNPDSMPLQIQRARGVVGLHDDYHMNNDNKQIHNWELRSYMLTVSSLFSTIASTIQSQYALSSKAIRVSGSQ